MANQSALTPKGTHIRVCSKQCSTQLNGFGHRCENTDQENGSSASVRSGILAQGESQSEHKAVALKLPDA